MATFVVAHGAWSAGWAWKKMHPLMRHAGHGLITPTYTGLGERGHLAAPDIDLETHIADMLGVLEIEDLRDVVLIGHSYGGMVATGVADRARNRIARLIYLDAFVPGDGQSLFDLSPPGGPDHMRDRARAGGDDWLVPSNPIPPDTSEADIAWIEPRRMDQPIKTLEQKLRLHNGALTLPRAYIYCTWIAPADPFGRFAEMARNDPDWRYLELDASHSPHITAPEQLRDLLLDFAAG